MKTFHIITFGCQMNVSDSEWMSRALTAMGFEEVDFDDAEIFILNTCSVRDKPEQKVYSELGRLKKRWDANPDIFACVGGCVAQQVGNELFKRFPWVRLVFGGDTAAMAPQAIERICREPGLKSSLLDFSDSYPERELHLEGMPAATPQAFVSIMKGCDNYCAYCIVPYTRGRQRSRSSVAIMDECKGLLDRGVREITLLGQNVNSYGLDDSGDGVGFAELLYKVGSLPGLERLRFITSHPKDLADEVIDAFGDLYTLCPSLHLPMQSGSDRMLKAMGRKYDMARYWDIVNRLRKVRPDLALTTDIIVGFPGETEEDFDATMKAVAEIFFDSSFSFMYSDRPGVRSEKLDNKIPLEVKAERLQRLQELQGYLTDLALDDMVGLQVSVLLEGPSRRQDLQSGAGSWRGHDPFGHTVNVMIPEDITGAAGDLTGKLMVAQILKAKKHSLLGESVGVPW